MVFVRFCGVFSCFATLMARLPMYERLAPVSSNAAKCWFPMVAVTNGRRSGGGLFKASGFVEVAGRLALSLSLRLSFLTPGICIRYF